MLIITGTIAYDYIMDFPGVFSDHVLPNQLHNINLSFIVNRFEKRRGGTAGNVSYTLGLLKTPNKLFSTVGNDFQDYLKGFLKKKLNIEGIRIDSKSYTATGFAITDKNDNQIWGFFYGAAEENISLKLGKIAKKGDFVLIGPTGSRATMNMVHECIEKEVPYMFDPGFILTQVTNDDLLYGVKYAKYIVGNDYEINIIKDRIKNYRELFKNKIIITTLGAKGAVIEEKNKKIAIKPVKVNKIVDPTGAGDGWRAGFLAGLDKNFDIQTCGQMGSVASSFVLEKYGTQEHSFSLKEFCRKYKASFGSKIEL